jgi:hypothetical protein
MMSRTCTARRRRPLATLLLDFEHPPHGHFEVTSSQDVEEHCRPCPRPSGRLFRSKLGDATSQEATTELASGMVLPRMLRAEASEKKVGSVLRTCHSWPKAFRIVGTVYHLEQSCVRFSRESPSRTKLSPKLARCSDRVKDRQQRLWGCNHRTDGGRAPLSGRPVFTAATAVCYSWFSTMAMTRLHAEKSTLDYRQTTNRTKVSPSRQS